jgi:hypothetical protein
MSLLTTNLSNLDQDCKDAMYENLVDISRMNERNEMNGDSTSTTHTQSSQPPSGRLTDEQLRAQLEARLVQDTQDDQEEEGLHL